MGKTETAAQYLAGTVLFGSMTDAEREALSRQTREATWESGAVIFSRGDPARDAYLVLEGRVRLSILSPEGREVSFTQAGPASIFGEVAAFDGGPRTAGATAVTRVRALTIDRATLRRIATENSRVAASVIDLLCSRLRVAADQLEAIALHPIEVRLARFLLARCRHLQAKATSRVTIDLGMTKTDLALFIGASRPKLSVALTLLEDVGAIERKGSDIVCDPRGLALFAGGDED